MSEASNKFRIEIETIHGGKMNYLYASREKAEPLFAKAREDETNAYGIFGTIDEAGAWNGIIDEFDYRQKTEADD
jgi:hypothetical protein